MKILLASPLYPPDIAEPAPYVKELARRLAKKHQITVITYGHLPEKVPGVSVVCTDKRRPLPIRLLRFTLTFLKTARRADILYVENGPSVEIAAGLTSFFMRQPLIIHIGDLIAHERRKEKFLLKCVERFAAINASKVIKTKPMSRPEILPFHPEPQAEFETYEKSWEAHLNELENLFKDVLRK